MEIVDRQPEQTYFRALPAKCYLEIPKPDFYQLCYASGRYGIPSLESVQFIKELMEPFSERLEIGSGAGDFAYHLGIRGTDSACQTTPEMTLIYAAIGQTVTDPPACIERIDALSAVRKYKPEVVFASWVTQRFNASRGDKEGEAQSFAHGVDEEMLLQSGVKRYIFMGNINSHGKKRILQLPHKEFSFPWLVSRSKDPDGNRLWVWDI